MNCSVPAAWMLGFFFLISGTVLVCRTRAVFFVADPWNEKGWHTILLQSLFREIENESTLLFISQRLGNGGCV